jgi:hypothetical protein
VEDYLQDYRRKLTSAQDAARLVRSDNIVNYGAFNIKPVDFDKALGARAGEPGLEKVYVKMSGGVPPAPAVITNDPEQKTF